MKKKIIYLLLIGLAVSSLVLLGFNYKSYTNNLKTKAKYKSDIKTIQDTNNNLDEEIETSKNNYEQLIKKNEKLLKEYEKWKKKIDEVKSYLL